MVKYLHERDGFVCVISIYLHITSQPRYRYSGISLRRSPGVYPASMQGKEFHLDMSGVPDRE